LPISPILAAAPKTLISLNKIASTVELMDPDPNALYIGNVLIAELFCQKNPGLVWREIEEFDQKTHFYFAVSPWLQNSDTEGELTQAIEEAFAELSENLNLG